MLATLAQAIKHQADDRHEAGGDGEKHAVRLGMDMDVARPFE
jgi:hypothetical protein